jgi:hypothetical protein
LLTIYFLLTNATEDNCQDAEGDYRDKDEDCAVHKEILGKDADDLVLPPTEKPVVFSGEEELVEYCECAVKVGCRKAAYHGKATQGEKTGGEGYVLAKWTAEHKYT